MKEIVRDMFVAILGTCSYGLALGLWRSPQMAFYVSVKLPVVFVGTTVLVSVFSWMSALLAGTEMRYRDVFACLSGGTMSFVWIAGLGLVCTAMMGCVMAALSPILWLFAVSTASVGFFTVFALAIAAVAAIFARRPIHAVASIGEVTNTAGLRVWFVVFMIVALQAVTLVRPMLSPLGERATPPGKCFFVRHFYHALFESTEGEVDGNGDKAER